MFELHESVVWSAFVDSELYDPRASYLVEFVHNSWWVTHESSGDIYQVDILPNETIIFLPVFEGSILEEVANASAN